jgi:hypothetical protein
VVGSRRGEYALPGDARRDPAGLQQGLERHALMQAPGGRETGPFELLLRQHAAVLEPLEQHVDVGERERVRVLEDLVVREAVVDDLLAVAVDRPPRDRLALVANASHEGAEGAAACEVGRRRRAPGLRPVRRL